MSKILFYDIETSPNKGAFFQLYKEGNIVWIEEHWHILSFAFKWLGDKSVKCYALPDFPLYKKDKKNDYHLVKMIRDLFDRADVVVAHNGVAFDTKKSAARFAFHNIPPPSPVFEVDTKLVAKRYFKFDSNKLDDIGDYLNIGRKLQTGGFMLWKNCLAGDMKAWSIMKKYNKGDVELLEKVYLRLRPYIKNHPNMALFDGHKTACPNCGSLNIHKAGFAFTRVTVNQRYKCSDCGHYSHSPMPSERQPEKQIR